MKTIKSVRTKSFELVLVQASNGLYYVGRETTGSVVLSEGCLNYSDASYIFDYRLAALEGN